MTTEFDIETPANMELLGGTPDDDEPETNEEAGEPAAEADETQDEAPEAAATEEETPPAKRDPVIPRARFDEVNAKLHAEREAREAAESRLDEIERSRRKTQSNKDKQAATSEADIDALEDQYFEAILEGDKDKAKGLRSKINAEIYNKAEAASTAAVSASLSQREAKTSFEKAVAQTVTEFPFLDSNSPESSPEAIAEVVEWRDFYIAKGDSPASALQKAAQKVAPLYATASPDTQPQVTDKRKQAAVANAAKANAAQPPRVDAGVGNRSIPAGDSIVGNQDKWEKASEAERMRFLM